MWLYSISKFFEHPYQEDLWVKLNFIVSLLLNAVLWAVLYYKLQPFSYLSDSGQIALHYNIYFGIDSIGSWYQVFILPLVGIFFIVFNNIFAYVFYLQEKMLSHFLVFSQTALQIILLAAGIFVILLNI